jgi:hypothetical protein
MSNDEIWKHNLKELKDYIDENNKRPSDKDMNEYIKKLGLWLITQIKNYAKNKNIMKDNIIRIEWEDFVTKYKEYFISNDELWKNNLKKVQKYIDDNDKRPNINDKNKDVRQISEWLSTQLQNYKKNENIMKNETISTKWKEFITEYNKYFLSNDELWKDNFEKVKKYIDDNGFRPSRHSKDENTKYLGMWISTQIKKYKKNETISTTWKEFITSEKYQQYFKITNQQ